MSEKTAIVTGGAKGIGRAISRALAASGWNLFICGRDEAALKAASAEIRSRYTVSIETYSLDLSEERGGAKFFDRWDNPGLPFPRALVCNAGDYGILGPLSQVDMTAWKSSFDLNFFSVAELIQTYVKRAGRSPSSQRRKIILMSGSGLGGRQVWGGTSAYSCAKAALYRLTEVLHEEIFPLGFDINCVAPGAVKTGITEQARAAGERALGKLYQATLKVQDDGGDPPELAADTIALLLSGKCDGLSGRLFSAKWDRKLLEDPTSVIGDPDLLRLRRVDNALFQKCPEGKSR